MAKKPIELRLSRMTDAAHENVPASDWAESSGIDANARLGQKLTEIGQLIFRHETESDDVVNAKLVRALELYESLEPADGAEGMLATQMVGTHLAALECLRRAALANQSFAGRDMALKHAAKLMDLYARQLQTLNKHRGKGQQKVTVEHVNVEAGGQAIVGHVQTGRGQIPQANPPRLSDEPGVALDPIEEPARKPARKGKT